MDELSGQMETSDCHETVPLLPTVSATHKDLECGSDATSKSNAIPTKKAGYGLFVAVCFSLNYSIGSGILGLPFEYFKSGFIMGSVLLCYLGLLTYITYTHVMDGMQRGEALTILANENGLTRTELMYDPSYTAERLRGTRPHELKSKYAFIKNEYQLSELIGMDTLSVHCNVHHTVYGALCDILALCGSTDILISNRNAYFPYDFAREITSIF